MPRCRPVRLPRMTQNTSARLGARRVYAAPSARTAKASTAPFSTRSPLPAAAGRKSVTISAISRIFQHQDHWPLGRQARQLPV
jgi:hypothetical protein